MAFNTPRCAEILWPAWLSRLVDWRWLNRSVTCPRCWIRSSRCWKKLGLRDEEIIIRMTGCPNGCARPMLAEIAFIGKAPGKYNMYLGGGFTGNRLNKLYKENIGEDRDSGVAAADSHPICEGTAGRRAFRRFCHSCRLCQRSSFGTGFSFLSRSFISLKHKKG